MGTRNSIQRKQTTIIMLICGAALLCACGSFVGYEVVTFRKEMVHYVDTLAAIVGNNSTASLDFHDAKDAKETLASLCAQPEIVAATIYTSKAKVLAKYSRRGAPSDL